jgi:hypothetical protein
MPRHGVLGQDKVKHVGLEQDMVSCGPRTGPMARHVILEQDMVRDIVLEQDLVRHVVLE